MSTQFKLATLVTGTLLFAATSAPLLAADAMLSTGGYAHQLQKMEMMKMLDANGDHMVTQAEADTYYSNIFDTLNKDNDDSLDAKEWAGASKESKIDIATGGYSRELRSMKMMKMMDADSNHLVTKEEFLNYHRTLFAKLDTSNDQQLDAQEWAAKVLGNK
ncbi:MAG TPA: calcium-binding protein [Methylophilaceae bacterium]|nr:calcium-binding protein [Methylophilaceae bacterium]HAJ71005.1 calcium-binding protein [Methylophilaceae bacterium]